MLKFKMKYGFQINHLISFFRNNISEKKIKRKKKQNIKLIRIRNYLQSLGFFFLRISH